MCYIHRFEIDFNFGMLYAFENDKESGIIDYQIQPNNTLKINDFQSGCRDVNYHQGTEMIIYLLTHLNINIYHIHGMLSTVDAKDEYKEIELNKQKRVGWHVSIPFYAGLTRYIPNSRFVLYNGIRDWKEDITAQYLSNPHSCIKKLIINNTNCSFSIFINNTNN